MQGAVIMDKENGGLRSSDRGGQQKMLAKSNGLGTGRQALRDLPTTNNGGSTGPANALEHLKERIKLLKLGGSSEMSADTSSRLLKHKDIKVGLETSDATVDSCGRSHVRAFAHRGELLTSSRVLYSDCSSPKGYGTTLKSSLYASGGERSRLIKKDNLHSRSVQIELESGRDESVGASMSNMRSATSGDPSGTSRRRVEEWINTSGQAYEPVVSRSFAACPVTDLSGLSPNEKTIKPFENEDSNVSEAWGQSSGFLSDIQSGNKLTSVDTGVSIYPTPSTCMMSNVTRRSSSGSSSTPCSGGKSPCDGETVLCPRMAKPLTPSPSEAVIPSSREVAVNRGSLLKRLKLGHPLRVPVDSNCSNSSPDPISSGRREQLSCQKELIVGCPEKDKLVSSLLAESRAEDDVLGDLKKRKAEKDPSIGDLMNGENGTQDDINRGSTGGLVVQSASVSPGERIKTGSLAESSVSKATMRHRMGSPGSKPDQSGGGHGMIQREIGKAGRKTKELLAQNSESESSESLPSPKDVRGYHHDLRPLETIDSARKDKVTSSSGSPLEIKPAGIPPLDYLPGTELLKNPHNAYQNVYSSGHALDEFRILSSSDAQQRMNSVMLEDNQGLSLKTSPSVSRGHGDAIGSAQLYPRSTDRSESRSHSVATLCSTGTSSTPGEQALRLKAQVGFSNRDHVKSPSPKQLVATGLEGSAKCVETGGGSAYSSGQSGTTTENGLPNSRKATTLSSEKSLLPKAEQQNDGSERSTKANVKLALPEFQFPYKSVATSESVHSVKQPSQDATVRLEIPSLERARPEDEKQIEALEGKAGPKSSPGRGTEGDPANIDEKRDVATTVRKVWEDSKFFWVHDSRYQKIGMIGRGGSSEVYKVINSEFTIYALKKIVLGGRDRSTAVGFYQEIEYLERLRGKEHIVQLIDYEVTNKSAIDENTEDGKIREDAPILMVLEFGEIDLAGILNKRRRKMLETNELLDINWIRFYWKHMLVAVKTIHDERIVHADLKPANFLLVKGDLKLIDFGIAKAIQSDTTHFVRDSQVGTLNYMAPEALMNSGTDEDGRVFKCGRSSDIWSLGCILYQMVYGVTPFSNITSMYKKIQAITSNDFIIKYPSVDNCSLLDVMKKCLTRDRFSRPHISHLLDHPFLRPDMAP